MKDIDIYISHINSNLDYDEDSSPISPCFDTSQNKSLTLNPLRRFQVKLIRKDLSQMLLMKARQ